MQKIKENKMSQSTGVTLVLLIITIIVLIILAGITVRVVLDDKVIEQAEKYTNKMDQQIEDKNSLSNMVRNLYEN